MLDSLEVCDFMNIAILGTRGIPARYGGFETFAEQLSKRLADRGHNVTVYCRRPFTRPDDVFDARIRRVILPGTSSKHFDTLINGLLSIIHVISTDADVVLICNVANSPYAWLPRLFGKPTVLNVDGLDRLRGKWNWLGQTFLHFCEFLSVFTPTRVVTDAAVIQQYYREHYHKASTLISYGAEVPDVISNGLSAGLPEKRYFLYVSRLEPENNPELVIRAYQRVESEWPLVILGGNAYRPEYVRHLQSLADNRVIFSGAIYGDGYWALVKNAGVSVYAGEVGGVHPALVEAMAAGKPILCLDNPSNRETVDDCAIMFQRNVEDLSQKMLVITQDQQLRDELSLRAAERAKTTYCWDEVTRNYEALFVELTMAKKKRRRHS
jgi:glycosyltransferase involved in cell wall biosynthesis